MKLRYNIYGHGVVMNVKFHRGVIRYNRSYCPLIAYILMFISYPQPKLNKQWIEFHYTYSEYI